MAEMVVLFYEFFKIGLFAIGGGLAALPFLYDLSDKYDWFTSQMVSDMVAISESTPGPLGVNMATYVGYQHNGILGGFIATLALILPSLIIVVIVSKMLMKFKNNVYVDRIFYTLRPTVTGLIAAACFGVILNSVFKLDLFRATGNMIDFFGVKEIILFAIMFYLVNKYKKHPIVYISAAAVIGIVFHF